MGANEAFNDLGPGLHVLREAEPLKRAGSMAAQLRADLCATLPQAEATLAERSGLPPIDVATLATLQVLSRRVARAERIAARTRERAVVEVGQRLTTSGSGIAVHPETVRERAAALELARTRLVGAERAAADHAAEVAEAEAAAIAEASYAAGQPDPDDLPPETAEASTPRRVGPPPHVRRSRSLGALVASFGIALLLLGFDVLALWAALLFPLATSLWAMRYLRPRPGDAADLEDTSTFLAEVASSTDDMFGARRRSQELAEQTVDIEAARTRAEEEVRVAERGWHELAGPDVDVADVEAVVKRFDPQHEDARLVAGETAVVRATDAVLHQFRQRWLAFWRELGMSAPEPADGERAVDELAARVGRPIVLVGPAAVRAPDLARAAPAAPVVVLEGPPEEEPAVS